MSEYLLLTDLREEIDRGRHKPEDKGPFYDLVVDIACQGQCPPEQQSAIAAFIEKIMRLLAEDIRSLNFSERPVQVSELEGKIRRAIILSKESALKEKAGLLVTEILALARRREQEILKQTK